VSDVTDRMDGWKVTVEMLLSYLDVFQRPAADKTGSWRVVAEQAVADGQQILHWCHNVYQLAAELTNFVKVRSETVRSNDNCRSEPFAYYCHINITMLYRPMAAKKICPINCHFSLFRWSGNATTIANSRQSMNSYILLVVTTALFCLVLQMLTM